MSEKKIVSLIKAEGKERTYQMEDGSVEKWTGGTVAWRNNNPGNLKFEYAGSADSTVQTTRSKEKALSDAQRRYDGIVALDQWGNAIFEDINAGRMAKIQLLANRFGEMNVHQMIRKYSVPDYSGKTHWDKQEETIYKTGEQQGVDLRGKKIAEMTGKELSALADGIAKFEGWKRGEITVIQEKKSVENQQSSDVKPVGSENIHEPQSKYDEVMAMIQGLINDTDGSYAQKVLAEHADKVARFDEKVRQSIEQDRQRELADRESQTMQHEEQQRGFSRSFG